MLGEGDTVDLAGVRENLVKAGCALLDKGLVAGTWGNLSVRLPGMGIAITPSGRDYSTMVADDIVVIDMQGEKLQGEYNPSSEWPLHAAIYAQRPDIQAIVHTHSVFASACAVARRAIPPVIEDLVQLGGGSIEVAHYALPGTPALADNAVRSLADKQAVLLANHGLVGCGQTLREAMLACELVEKAAQIYLYANQLGGAHILSDEDVTVMRDFYLQHYRQRQGG